MTVRFFADSNVLIYARDSTEAAKQRRASLWVDYLWEERAGRLSYQVLIECYSVLTRRRGMAADQARIYIESFLLWQPVVIDAGILARAWLTQDRFSLNWFDCLIVAAARLSECDFLLTEDLQHGQDLDGIVAINPFEVAPGAVR
jgi:predicted nucleic acid-binding protein